MPHPPFYATPITEANQLTLGKRRENPILNVGWLLVHNYTLSRRWLSKAINSAGYTTKMVSYMTEAVPASTRTATQSQNVDTQDNKPISTSRN